jgi:hydrogenase/urease accessory protein HupE
MKTHITSIVLAAMTLLPAVCFAHPGHGPESGILHELNHTHWLIVFVFALALLAVSYQRRLRRGRIRESR